MKYKVTMVLPNGERQTERNVDLDFTAVRKALAWRLFKAITIEPEPEEE